MATKSALLQSESTLTDRYQTTIPDAVRTALGLGKRNKIRYTIQSNGQVILSKAKQTEDDPALEPFLTFLALDIKDNPQRLRAASSDLVGRVKALTAGVEINLDAPLSDEDE